MTAPSQLSRLLHLLPLAARAGGASFDELADAMGLDRDRLLGDLEALTTREFYHPAGEGDDIQVGLEGDRVRVWTTGALQRPVRLDLREAAALHLGLRLLAAERDDPGLPDDLRDLEERIAWAVPDEAAGAIAAGDPAGRDAVRAGLVDAARRRRRVEIDYLKPVAAGPERRVLDPWVVAYAEGHAYVIGHDHGRGDVRVFRLDRVMETRVREESFDPPTDFDPADYLDGGRVYHADEEIEVTVRYGPRVARWILERGAGKAEDDGSVVVEHTVSDPGWIVRHVLRYGPDAEVLAPEEARAWVAHALATAAAGEPAGSGSPE